MVQLQMWQWIQIMQDHAAVLSLQLFWIQCIDIVAAGQVDHGVYFALALVPQLLLQIKALSEWQTYRWE